MATVCAHLPTPVTATVIKPFGSFLEGQQVEIDRVTSRALWFGVRGRGVSIPCTNVNEEARRTIRMQFEAVMYRGETRDSGGPEKGAVASRP